MKNSFTPMFLSAILLAAFLISALLTSFDETVVDAGASSPSIEMAQGLGLDLTAEQIKADALVRAVPVYEVLGSLAPIALSPFFALTCLSGASLLADAGLLPSAVSSNFMLSSNSPLNNEAVFLGLLVLTLLTAAPKLTKVSKPFAQAVDQLEAYSGIVAALAVQVLSRVGEAGPSGDEIAMVYTAGLLTFSYNTMLMVFSAINIFVINSVKFFFEVMILISPIPTIDAIFEALNKAFAAFLLAVYLINPWLATVFNVLIFLVSLIMFAWTYRRVVFMRCVMGDPFFGWLGERFGMRVMTANATRLPKSIARKHPDATVVLKAFCGKKIRGVSRKSRGFFVQDGDRSLFIKPRILRADKVIELNGEGISAEVVSGIFANRIVFWKHSGEMSAMVLFTKRYNLAMGQIQQRLNARSQSLSSGDSAAGMRGMGKDLAASIRSSSRSELQSDFA